MPTDRRERDRGEPITTHSSSLSPSAHSSTSPPPSGLDRVRWLFHKERIEVYINDAHPNAKTLSSRGT